MMLGYSMWNKEGEGKRRVIVLKDNGLNVEAGIFSLKLAGNGYPVMERDFESRDGMIGKTPRVGRGTSNQAVCEVEDDGADMREMKCRRQRPVRPLWELRCRGSVKNVVGFTFFESLIMEIEPVEDAWQVIVSCSNGSSLKDNQT